MTETYVCPADCSPELVDGSGEFSWPCSECGRDWTKYPETGYAESDPRYYGVAPEEIVACYFEGTLTPELVAEGHVYNYGHYHKACEPAARQMFTALTVEKPSIEASELDWSKPYHCDVCEESIT